VVVNLAYNTTNSPVMVDCSGFTIGGGEWGVVDTLDDCGKEALAAGDLVLADEEQVRANRGGDPFVGSVLAALEQRRALEEQVSGLSKDDLLATADPDTVAALPVGGDGKPSKADLVDAVVADKTAEGAEPETEAAPKATASKTTKKSTTSRSAAK
jgi:hypothetical protein